MVKIFVCGDFRAKKACQLQISEDLKCKILDADISICNFEAPIESEGTAAFKSGPVLDQDPLAPALLKELGFNVILISNNHIMDYGIIGCEKTKMAFKDCLCVGAGSYDEAYSVAIKEVNGLKIGFLSLVQHEFGVVESKNNRGCYGTAWINSPDIQDVVIDAKRECDYLLVFPHAGVEHIDAPLPQWRLCYRKFVEWGADVVIASHPHCPQGWEEYKGRHIYYSLGNFYFDEIKGGKNWYRSLGIVLSIDKNVITSSVIYLAFNDGIIRQDDSQDMKKHINYVNQILNDENEYNSYIKNKCLDIYEGKIFELLRGVGGFSFHLKPRLMLRLLVHFILNHKNEADLLNICQNESHRWVIENVLNQKNINKL